MAKLPPEMGGDGTEHARCPSAKPDVQIQLIQTFLSPHMVSSQHGCRQAGTKPSRIASALENLERSGLWCRSELIALALNKTSPACF